MPIASLRTSASVASTTVQRSQLSSSMHRVWLSTEDHWSTRAALQRWRCDCWREQQCSAAVQFRAVQCAHDCSSHLCFAHPSLCQSAPPTAHGRSAHFAPSRSSHRTATIQTHPLSATHAPPLTATNTFPHSPSPPR
jgi:hypothetical protein